MYLRPERSRLMQAGQKVSNCQSRRDPGLACSRLVRLRVRLGDSFAGLQRIVCPGSDARVIPRVHFNSSLEKNGDSLISCYIPF